ncbi:MerR family transcriptional regulator [Patescibacteria group bacterium]|nr:MerR family transcriptional regulator [Patescibacteria group bacterium]MBU1868664.1 MerR family transcriptional regulator [Patescibacteria group bacterium]
MNNYLTAGELAKLASTTKRTILFYDEKNILEPVEVNNKGYRYYLEDQVLDYQKILLLTTLGVSLDEIRLHLKNKGNLTQLFNEKKSQIRNQIKKLEFNLDSLEKFSNNINNNGTMVNPEIKTIEPFDVYYIEKIGPYVKIAEYCKEFIEMFDNRGKEFTTLAIFENPTYQPKKSKIKIGALVKKDMKIGEKHKDTVKRMTFSPGKVITHTYNGSGSLLSLFWKELEKYCMIKKIKIRKDVPDFEIYRKVSEDPVEQFFEIYLPIR